MRRLMLSLALVFSTTAAGAQEADLDALFEALRAPDQPGWEQIEARIRAEMSRSGSAAMDLLLERGREAIAAEEFTAAIEHLTALVENAPGFPEGWNARATAYFQAGLYGPAMADIAKVLTLEPRHFAAIAGLGRILEEAGQPRAALEAYARAVAIHPHRPDLREAVERLEAELQGTSV